MLDKKQWIGAGVAVVALVGVSVATGKIDINNLFGTAEPEVTFERKLPPPVSDNATSEVDAALAAASEESETADFAAELLGQPVEPARNVETSATAPEEASATLASTNLQSVIDTSQFVKTPVVKENELPPVSAPDEVPTVKSSIPVAKPTPVVSALTDPAIAANANTDAIAQAAIASLPETATGEDLIRLQTHLALIEKQKALAAGEEAIAESQLKVAKARYEMAQIGKPSAEEVAAEKKAQAELERIRAAAEIQPQKVSPLNSVRVLSTARANGSTYATISFNGKLVDVKKGSFVGGYLIDQVTDTHVKFIGESETKTVWIN